MVVKIKITLWAMGLCCAVFTSCANVKPWEREFLSSRVMNEGEGATKLSLEEKFFSTQEGSAGSTEGMAGGCGCAK